ncbi:hypothetical protein [Zymomonas mobilis]|uniref:Uncharacterized protein n=1 Tax=Zymomonas mobilis subsp. mobilis (strain ATCC 31821 / ZM4 / CP4) TaxID=264203 RepID=A0A806D7W1_ZYMMO|nr:hypothetical protein [Zymomonas mobilis]ADC33914.1 hypothetical protein ZZM4_0149 [Zymomonas mobilis subsp. mobilis ZM4 = ATCC 31821]AHB11146.1 hypothetical protein ZCP4_1895 [Zymomonas mobilis subsp. mobilis str. CP4 = NRRL B-14023]AHJ71390.1 hypothetical protein A254_01807 [Zymomonas mobilis subsp. mobilis NRRL B-12526]AHJ73244.1 hypothetical protein A265_01807 [Zymomonas mobilis subsp. mobilis str. CP4 = NRRL B-14023]
MKNIKRVNSPIKRNINTKSLKQADREYILKALKSFSNKDATLWIEQKKTIEWGSIEQLDRQYVVDAVAASAPNHCIDGWGFASRALSSILVGDGHTARHLAYYAQLRAALSILANLGVGIFNGTNFVINRNGNIIALDYGKENVGGRLGTHIIVWKALTEWSKNPISAEIFLNLIKIRGNSLFDCISAIYPSGSKIIAVEEMIRSWGVDLSGSKSEQMARNISSYMPQLSNPLNSGLEGLKLVKDFWDLFELGASHFDKIDLFLLRMILQKQHHSIYNKANYADGAIKERHNELPDNIKSAASIDFLTKQGYDDYPFLIKEAKKNNKVKQPTEMLARAFILLRIATGFTQSSFQESGILFNSSNRFSWLKSLIEMRGFFDISNTNFERNYLWDDMEDALLDFEDSIDPIPGSMFEWMQKGERGLPTISQAERVGVWSLYV